MLLRCRPKRLMKFLLTPLHLLLTLLLLLIMATIYHSFNVDDNEHDFERQRVLDLVGRAVSVTKRDQGRTFTLGSNPTRAVLKAEYPQYQEGQLTRNDSTREPRYKKDKSFDTDLVPTSYSTDGGNKFMHEAEDQRMPTMRTNLASRGHFKKELAISAQQTMGQLADSTLDSRHNARINAQQTVKPSMSGYEVGQPPGDERRNRTSKAMSPYCEKRLLLVILVTSSPGNSARRYAIRKTWALDNIGRTSGNHGYEGAGDAGQPRYQTIFILGGSSLPEATRQSMLAESKQYGDLLIGDYADTYRLLVRKVLYGLSWASEQCEPRHVLKTDDDCFVDPDLLCRELMIREESGGARDQPYLYFGQRMERGEPIRDPESPWYVSRADYPMRFYLPYASGMGYVLSLPALRGILFVAAFNRPFPVEDAYIGVLAAQAGISPIGSRNFILPDERLGPFPATLCKRPYVIHGVRTLEEQRKHHQVVLDYGLCNGNVNS